jgi:RNA-binding protein FUS
MEFRGGLWATQDMGGESCKVEMSRSSGKGEVKPGDWQCKGCGVNNFARRDACFRCGERGGPDNGGGGGGGGYGGGGGGGGCAHASSTGIAQGQAISASG